MRVMAMCPQCIEDAHKAGKKPAQCWKSAELDDNGIAHTTCDKGHIGQVVYDSPRHSVLIDSAARAFLDGYTNEVVAVISTALERAYEFYLRVVFRSKGVSPDDFSKMWKGLASSSERQYGAFSMLSLFVGSDVKEIDKRIPETRNKVIHRGHIVREGEALDYAERVFARIRAIERELESRYKEHVIAESKYQVEAQQKLVPMNVESVVMKTMAVEVDKKTNTVVGVPEKFISVVAGVHHARERGFVP